MAIEEISLDRIRVDGGTQSRCGINPAAVRECAEDMDAGKILPPGEAVFDGEEYWLWDGFHRFEAEKTRVNGNGRMRLAVRKGTLDEAKWLCAGANKVPGISRRTNDDKNRAVTIALEQKPEMSDRLIAEHCGVRSNMVGGVRKQLSLNDSSKPRIGRDGKSRKPPTQKPRKKKEEKPDPSDTEKDEDAQTDDGQRPEPEVDPLRSEVVTTTTQLTPAFVAGADIEADTPITAGSPAPSIIDKPVKLKPPPKVDDWGIPIQPHAAAAFDDVPKFQELATILRRAQKLFSDMAECPGGRFLLLPDVSTRKSEKNDEGEEKGRYVHTGLAQAIKQILAAAPAHTTCPWRWVEAPHPTDCRTCMGLDWTPELSKQMENFGKEKAKEHFGV